MYSACIYKQYFSLLQSLRYVSNMTCERKVAPQVISAARLHTLYELIPIVFILKIGKQNYTHSNIRTLKEKTCSTF